MLGQSLMVCEMMTKNLYILAVPASLQNIPLEKPAPKVAFRFLSRNTDDQVQRVALPHSFPAREPSQESNGPRPRYVPKAQLVLCGTLVTPPTTGLLQPICQHRSPYRRYLSKHGCRVVQLPAQPPAWSLCLLFFVDQ